VHSNAIARDVSEPCASSRPPSTPPNPGQVCPAKWKEGAKTLAPSLDLVGKI
jgi:peroxiredoxin (alkyl hydroperoxide reductase subunit C)